MSSFLQISVIMAKNNIMWLVTLKNKNLATVVSEHMLMSSPGYEIRL